MELSYLSIVLCLLLLAIPACMFYLYDEQLLVKGTGAIVRMLVQVIVGGLLTYFVIVSDDYRISLLWVLLLAALAAFGAVRKGHLPAIQYVPVLLGLLVSSVAVGFYLLMAVVRVPNPLQASLLVPLMALLIGHSAAVESRGVNAWLQARHDYREQYEYLRGNGATHLKALAPSIRRAMQQGLAASLANAKNTGLYALPLLLCALLLAGMPPLQSLAWTVYLCVGCLAASVLALVVTLWVSDRLLTSSNKPSK